MDASNGLSAEASGTPVRAEFAWFGKLPSAGDFISRRMSYGLQQFWDGWFAVGMEALKSGSVASGWDVWRGAPNWAFLLPAQAGVQTAQLGVWAPSCDRVGRLFPFLVTTSLVAGTADLLLVRAASLALVWSEAITQAQYGRHAMDALDAKLEVTLAEVLAAAPAPEEDADKTLPRGMNPAGLPWPDLARSFDPHGSESYWWSVPPASSGFRARTHVGALNGMQFVGLCA